MGMESCQFQGLGSGDGLGSAALLRSIEIRATGCDGLGFRLGFGCRV